MQGTRGLSKLQKLIIQIARDNNGVCTNRAALTAYYGPGPHKNARHVAVVRAFDRLAERGIAKRKWGLGVVLAANFHSP